MRRTLLPQKFAKQAIVVIAISLASLHPDVYGQIPASRRQALRMMNGCANRPVTLNCNEETAAYLIRLYKRGDRTLLRTLLDANLRSDGALAESLGTFCSDVLYARPRTFLSGLRSRPQKQQRSLCWSAGATDGGGMGVSTLRKVRSSLRAISSHHDNLAKVAKVCLYEVNRFNAGR
jgi:hypothetical protein